MDTILIIYIATFGLFLGCIVGMTSIGKGLIGTTGLLLMKVANPVGTVAVAGVFMMLSSTFKHYKNKNISIRTAVAFSITAFPLSFIFAMFAEKINAVVNVKYIIAGAIIISVITLVYKFFISKAKDEDGAHNDKNIVLPLILGAILGFFIGVTSISGSLIVIAFMMILKMPERLAIGTTNFVAIFALIAASAAHISNDNVNWLAVVAFTPTVMIGAYIGANLTNVVPKKPLQIVILCLLFIAAIGIVFKKDNKEHSQTTIETEADVTTNIIQHK